jgi:hypothetical protein
VFWTLDMWTSLKRERCPVQDVQCRNPIDLRWTTWTCPTCPRCPALSKEGVQGVHTGWRLRTYFFGRRPGPFLEIRTFFREIRTPRRSNGAVRTSSICSNHSIDIAAGIPPVGTEIDAAVSEYPLSGVDPRSVTAMCEFGGCHDDDRNIGEFPLHSSRYLLHFLRELIHSLRIKPWHART